MEMGPFDSPGEQAVESKTISDPRFRRGWKFIYAAWLLWSLALVLPAINADGPLDQRGPRLYYGAECMFTTIVPMFWVFGVLIPLGIGNYAIIFSPIVLLIPWTRNSYQAPIWFLLLGLIGCLSTPLLWYFADELLVGAYVWLPVNTLFLVGCIMTRSKTAL